MTLLGNRPGSAGEAPPNYYHVFGLGQLMGCLGLKRVEEGPQKGIRHSRSIINRVPEDLYVARRVGWGEAKKNLINNQPVLETQSHAEEELRETSKASYLMNRLSYF